jgi:hypothetical protein
LQLYLSHTYYTLILVFILYSLIMAP